ncbi:prolyl oligopeptidase [Alteribacter lacisalsi]|uniref:Prolyl oligopeptidase n=1 Tax=Alteribacter lacisalsi TaxID=2045244 RepID=A0A2W0H9X7_9BACI|nr:prolyl oligopeptidase family serine peptidase [Alteribacter lacisalsi]PYZ97596.1 prolyl oligopeptidase [Alteribacter lacisalsi]
MNQLMKYTTFIVLLCALSACGEAEVLQELEEVTTSNDTTVKRFTYDSEGLEIEGYLVRPEVDEAEELPVLIYNRGGNRNFGAINHQTINDLRFWAVQGYVVLASQYRGAGGSEGSDQFGGDDLSDVLWLQDVAEELSYADTSRMVMIGYSRGGMMTYLAAKEGMDLKAAAVIGAPADLFQGHEESGPRMKGILEELVGDPEEDAEAYEARSAVHWPEEIGVPTLILHGEEDQEVNVLQSERLYAMLDSMHEMIIYPEADHGLSGYRDEYREEVLDWFERHLEKE